MAVHNEHKPGERTERTLQQGKALVRAIGALETIVHTGWLERAMVWLLLQAYRWRLRAIIAVAPHGVPFRLLYWALRRDLIKAKEDEMQRKNPLLIAITLSLMVTVSACGGATPEPTATPAPTDTPSPTDTPTPTDTPIPTDTPTPKPTDTPTPTDTPMPTATPTPVPEVQTYSGTGDSVVDVETHVGPAIVHVVGNASGRYFAVENYGPNNTKMDLLVNTTAPYDGYHPLDWRDDEETTRFSVEAVGQWTIEIIPFAPIPEVGEHVIEVPGTYEGKGDDVIILAGETPDLAKISGNNGDRYFSVEGYTDGYDLLVNTTEPYDGIVLLNPDTWAFEVTASGPWTIEVTSAE